MCKKGMRRLPGGSRTGWLEDLPSSIRLENVLGGAAAKPSPALASHRPSPEENARALIQEECPFSFLFYAFVISIFLAVVESSWNLEYGKPCEMSACTVLSRALYAFWWLPFEWKLNDMAGWSDQRTSPTGLLIISPDQCESESSLRPWQKMANLRQTFRRNNLHLMKLKNWLVHPSLYLWS